MASLTATSLISPEHELDDILAEWANMTGFLSALGSVWLPSRQQPKHSHNTYLVTSADASVNTSTTSIAASSVLSFNPFSSTRTMPNNNGINLFNSRLPFNSSISFNSSSLASTIGVVEPPVSSASDLHYCPVTQFIGDLLKLLTCQNDKFGFQVQRHVQDLLGHELSTFCYPILFEQIKVCIFYDF